MKQNIFRKLMLIAVLLTGSHAFAHDFEIDGIYYNILSKTDKTVEVTYKGSFYSNYKEYSGHVSIPETVTYNSKTYSVISIGKEAFRDCNGLTSVIIPNSVTSIGSYAFSSCSGLEEIICESVTPATAYSNTFTTVSATATLYVPIGAKNAYVKAEGWNVLTNIVEDDVKTGVESTLAEDVNVSVENGNIVINGADNAKVDVYSVNGQCVYSGNATNIPVTAKGLYIVKIGNKSFKVIL